MFDIGSWAAGGPGRRPSVYPVLFQYDENVDSRFPLEFACPDLPELSAVCVGLTIDWRDLDRLHRHAVEATTPQEHAHAASFLKRDDALRHLVGRSMLRRVASRYAATGPLQPLEVNAWGKPGFSCGDFDCNLSHAGDQVWVALAFGCKIGIDVESAFFAGDVNEISGGFHPQEIADLRDLPDPTLATLRCWSRKESVAKALGMGLSLPLHAYAVDCGDDAAGWLRVAPAGSIPANWTTTDLPVGEGYVGALAVHGQCGQVHVLRLEPAS